MDIFEILSNKVFGPFVVIGVALVMGVLYVVGRLIYLSVFRHNLVQKNRSFGDEANENANRPMSGSETVGSISMRLGDDVRDVWGKGYSDKQINGVLTGKYSLAEMYKMAPDGNTKTETGKELLAKKDRV